MGIKRKENKEGDIVEETQKKVKYPTAKKSKNKIRFLYFGDFHNVEKAPTSRIDDFQDTCDKKAAEILAIAKKYNVDAMLQPGDFFDKPIISDAFFKKILDRWFKDNLNDNVKMVEILDTINATSDQSDLIDTLKQILDINRQSIPMIGIVGNHEQLGGNQTQFEKTALSLLHKLGLMTLVTEGQPKKFMRNGKTISIVGTNYFKGIDEDGQNSYLVKKDSDTDLLIHLVHGEVVADSFGTLFDHTQVKSFISETEADIVLTGHDHIGYEAVCEGNKTVVNPGSIMRLSATKAEMERQPKILLIEIDCTDMNYHIYPINLSSEKGEAVLSREHLDKKAEQHSQQENYKNLIENACLKKEDNLSSILLEIADTNEIAPELKENIVKRVSELYKDRIKKHFDETTPTFRALDLINFQSHKESHFDFSDGINVLTGETRSGKTSVLRAFDWILNNCFKNPRRCIHKDEKFASAILTLSNGWVIERKIERKNGGFNGYLITDTSGIVEKYNTNGVDLAREMCGFADLVISDKKSIPLNFLKQGASWFFIGEDTSGHDRAKIIGSVYDTNLVDQIQKEIETEIRKCKTESELIRRSNEETEMKVKAISHLDNLKETIDKIQASNEYVESLTKEVEINRKRMTQCKEMMQGIEVIEKALKPLQHIAKHANVCTSIQIELKEHEHYKKLCKALNEITQDGAVLKEVVEKCKTISNNGKSIIELQSLIDEFKKMKILETSVKDMGIKIRKYESKVIGLKRIVEPKHAIELMIEKTAEITKNKLWLIKSKDEFNIMREGMAKVNNLKATIAQAKVGMDIIVEQIGSLENNKIELSKIQLMMSQGKEFTKQIAINKEKMKVIQVERDKVFKDMKVCPLCSQSIPHNCGETSKYN